jgi:ribosomal protein S18 acetylase RimI-like enzyme
MEESRMVLRVILVEQVDLVKDLWLELAEHHWRRAQRIAALASPVTPEVSWSMRRAQYESWAPEPGWLLLGAELDGRIVGYAASRVVPVASSWDFGERMGKLETLVIQPGMRGRGAGRQLFDAVRRHWRALGVAYGSVSVMAENSDAVGFYESLGAVEHSRIFCYPALRRPCHVPHQRPALGRPDQQRRGRRRGLEHVCPGCVPELGTSSWRQTTVPPTTVKHPARRGGNQQSRRSARAADRSRRRAIRQVPACGRVRA